MEVTYICNMGYYNISSVSERVIPAALEACGINVHYYDFITEDSKIWTSSMLQGKSWIDKVTPHILIGQKVYDGEYNDEMKKKIADMNDVVLMTTMGKANFYLIKEILNSGRKVVLGGPYLPIFTSATLRQFLVNLGVEQRKVEDNLIFVYGFVDLTTDFNTIINQWKDTTIENNRLETIYEVSDFRADIDRIKHVGLVFNLECIYGKCKFCSRKLSLNGNFLINADSTVVVDNIRKLSRNIGSEAMYVSDDYFIFTKKTLDILDQVSDKNFEIQTGIHALLNENYIKNVNKHVKTIKIGVETATDYGLGAYGKGFTYNTIKKAVDQMIKYMDRDKFICFNVIVDSPQRDQDGIRTNYKRLSEIQDKLRGAGFSNFEYSVYALSVNLSPELLNGNYKIDREAPNKYLAGMSYLIRSVRPIDNSLSINKGGLPLIPYNEAIVRMDEHGDYLESDMIVMGNDYLSELFD